MHVLRVDQHRDVGNGRVEDRTIWSVAGVAHTRVATCDALLKLSGEGRQRHTRHRERLESAPREADVHQSLGSGVGVAESCRADHEGRCRVDQRADQSSAADCVRDPKEVIAEQWTCGAVQDQTLDVAAISIAEYLLVGHKSVHPAARLRGSSEPYEGLDPHLAL